MAIINSESKNSVLEISDYDGNRGEYKKFQQNLRNFQSILILIYPNECKT